MNKPTVSIVIVTWNSQKDIDECLQSVKNQSYKDISEVVVVDNNSSDSTVKKIKKHGFVTLIESKKNNYFAEGNNIGIRHTFLENTPDYIALLNPDAIAEENWIEESIKSLEEKRDVGIISPRVLFAQGEHKGKINSAGLVFDGFLQAYDRGFQEEIGENYNSDEEMAALSGTAMVIRTKALLETGLLWKAMRMYVEDVELSIRMRKKGWKLLYSPKSQIWHKYMSSTNQNKDVKKEGWKRWNFLLMALRHYSLKSKIAMVKSHIRFKLNS